MPGQRVNVPFDIRHGALFFILKGHICEAFGAPGTRFNWTGGSGSILPSISRIISRDVIIITIPPAPPPLPFDPSPEPSQSQVFG